MTPRYVLLDPGGNRTILVTDPVPLQQRPALSTALLAAEASAEQLGFLEETGDECHIRVCMAGGEFCGNATLCAAVLYGSRHRTSQVRVGMSGAEDPLDVSLQPLTEGWLGRVSMPLPKQVETRHFSLDGRRFALPTITLPGITHLLLTEALADSDAERAVKQWCRELQVPGLGLMMLEKESMRLRPLVYIPGADTLYWERSCASGTAAVGAALALIRGESLTMKLEEPGGTLGLEARLSGGKLERLVLENRILWDGKFKFPP